MDILIRKPTQEELDSLGVSSWPIWTCEPSTFDWYYDDRETCYILEGEVTVKTPQGSVHFGAGDLVVFPQGLSCTWTVAKKVRKHYNFG
ncbi:MAG: cupin domain-containing protein [Candidatus Sumerlaeia bacterium]|nr:cupin domain-containing protein [Candidatus Sumerlaeia bacterium]